MPLKTRKIFIEKRIETDIRRLEKKLIPLQRKKEYFVTVLEESLEKYTIQKFTDEMEDLNKQIEKKVFEIEKNVEGSKKLNFTISLRSRKRKLFGDSYLGIPVKKLSWKFFPKGQWTVEGIIKEFGKYVSHDEKIDEKRLRKIVDNLKPSYCYIGEEKFNRYIAFCFEGKDKVILESPIYGNAIYVIKGDWQSITKLHKWEARQSSKVTVIHHNETWFSRLQSNLNSRY